MHRIVFMLALILAGELIFGLPFHTTRYFRPTFLQVFGLSNTQLGDIFAVCGITAMLAWLNITHENCPIRSGKLSLDYKNFRAEGKATIRSAAGWFSS